VKEDKLFIAPRKMTIVAAKDSRNLSWANDTSSFGHRMLKKMGWTDGKVSNHF
jgi:Pin2-interacting protein X1